MTERSLVLVVDDAPDNLTLLTDLLEFSGYDVLIAHGGESALTQAEQEQPDIILLDVMMPGMDGFETCRRLKQNPATRAIPVIFMTALSKSADKVKGFKLGAVDYVTKPVEREEALARIKTHLMLRQQQIEIEQRRQHDRQYYKMLTQMRDDFLQTATHDLKTPLTVISLTVGMLRRHGRVDDADGEEMLNNIDQGVDEMRDLIGNLLDLAKLETGNALNIQEVELAGLLRHLHSDFALIASEKLITLELEEMPYSVIAWLDPARIRQAVSNLISNAIKYTPAGGHVEIRLHRDRDTATIQVRDNGPGIPAKDLPYVFDKFYRSQHEDLYANEGSGLGLAIVKSIVEQHKGMVRVDSELGRGSLFTLRLPAIVLANTY
jgi:signal transduction histidine kinase